MDKQRFIEITKRMIQAAGTDRVRALFQKYSMRGVSPNVTGVITGIQLYGQPFAADFAALVSDAARARAGYDLGAGNNYGIPGGPASSSGGSGSSWLSDVFNNLGSWLNGAAGLASSLNGNPYVPTPQAGGSGSAPMIVVPGQQSGSDNTALIIVIVVVVVLVGALIAFFALKKK